MSRYTVVYTVLVIPSSSEPSSAPPTIGGLVTVGSAASSDSVGLAPEPSSSSSQSASGSPVVSGPEGTEAEGALGSTLGTTATVVAEAGISAVDSSGEGGSKEQVAETMTVLVA